MTYPPQITSVRSARRFVEDAVASSDVPALADDAGLLVSELAANAVLHARTDFDVAVYSIHDGVRITVRDRSATLPVLVAPSATAMSGRGLSLVQALATSWGAGPSASAPKSVWFELTLSGVDAEEPGGAEDSPALELSVEELLAAWSEDTHPSPVSSGRPGPAASVSATAAELGPGRPGSAVTLPALDAVDLLGAKEAMEDVLRELQLLLLAEAPRALELADQVSEQVTDQVTEQLVELVVQERDAGSLTTAEGHGSVARAFDLAVADQLDRAARAFADVRSQVRHQVSRAVAAGQQQVELHLVLGEHTAQRATAYADAVEAAEQLAGTGSLLSVAGALARHRAVRRAYLLEVIAAAST
ncbi:ATP-binding protein [Quadrisphaera sp. INWT6]|uniref:ATP-binding protein n=1 Tax=Quadrisphaera sp. INWT6 TaxID=2596917 RepID=UPI0018927092|nr:ATP-binding protein [Quadrisphaera sp. INWT6]MBF5082347.1 ATP-binding protein [Quadrisphaera sp. INWT6]